MEFCSRFQLSPLLRDSNTLVLYTTFLACVKFTSYQGIKNVLSSIRTFHSACGYSIPSPTEDYSLHHALRGARKFLSRPVNQKLPINSRILAALLAQFDVDSPFCSLMLLSYLTFLRLSSIVPTTLPFLPIVHLAWHNVKLDQDKVVIYVMKSKTIQCLESNLMFTVNRHSNKSVCLVDHLLALRKLATYPILPYDPVFSFKTSTTWTPFTRTRAISMLKTALETAGLNSSSFAWSSFRRGPASDYLVAGGDVEFLRMHGGWESSEFRKYLAIPSAHRARVSSTLQDLF